MKPDKKQIGGKHYNNMPISPWDIITANGLDFFEGNVLKYILRWRVKGGIADLEKAIHYLEKLIEVERENGS